MFVYIYIGMLVGGILGITGAGGGIIALPALVSFAGLSIHQAIPIALIAISSGAGIAAIEGIKKGIVRYKAALWMVLVGIPFSFIGIKISKFLPQRLLFILFSIVMLIVSIRLIYVSIIKNKSRTIVISRVDPKNGRFKWNNSTRIFLGGVGACSGFISGLLGVGGGFIIVPLLKKFTNLSMHSIVSTSLMVIALVSCGGVFSSIIHGVDIGFKPTILFSASTIFGMLIGRKISVNISEKHIQIGFSFILILVAIIILIKNINL